MSIYGEKSSNSQYIITKDVITAGDGVPSGCLVIINGPTTVTATFE